MKLARKIAVGAMTVAAGLSVSPALAEDCTIKIGAVLPTSVDWGRPIAATTQLAVELFNAAGGVKGCEVELTLRDSQVDPKVGVDAAKALVDLEKVPVLLGAVSSGVSMPILTSVTVPSKVMQMSCCSASTAFTGVASEGKTNGLWFRTYATTRNQSAVAALLIRERGYKNVAIFFKNDDWGQDVGRLLKADLEKMGVEAPAAIAITDGQSSYRSEVTEALKAEPDAIYLALYPAEGALVTREWISLGGSPKMVVANSLKSDEYRDSVGLKYLEATIGHDSAQPRTASAQDFVALYREEFGAEPSGPGLPNAFDAAMIALLAMEAAEGSTGPAIAAAVPKVTDTAGEPIFPNVEGLKEAKELLRAGKTVSYQGGTGPVKFDANGDVSAPAVAWKFDETGTQEVRYFTLEQVDEFIASLED